MKNSFMDALAEKEAPIKETKEKAETISAEADVIAEEQEFEADEQEAEIEEEDLPQAEISEETRKQLFDKGSFLEKIREEEMKMKEEEEALAQSQNEEEGEEQDEEEDEEDQEEEVKAEKFEVEIDGQKFESKEALNEHLKTIHEERKALQEEVEEIRSFVEKVNDPELVQVLKYVAQGYSYRVAMIKAGMDESIFQVEADDPDAEDLVRAKIERKEYIKQQAKEQEELQRNMESTNKSLAELQAEEGFDDTIKDNLINAMSDFFGKGLKGDIAKDNMRIFLKGLNYEKAVKDAKEAGEIKGRNEKITIERQKKKGDNLPNLGRGISQEQPIRKSRLQEMVNVPSGSFMEKIRKN